MAILIKKLNRFTTLPILLDYLEREKLVLLDPVSWDDKNDTLIIESYKRRSKIPKLFALCFCYKDETIHHWKTFANGTSGCCIEFDAVKLLPILDKITGLKHGVVNYKKIKETGTAAIPLNDIPFTKRIPYEMEGEYRILWEGDTGFSFEIDVPLSFVRRITFSQQIPKPVFGTIKQMLSRNYPALAKKIFRSTIYENQTWVNNFK